MKSLVYILLASWFIAGCSGNNSRNIDTHLINNPVTADGKEHFSSLPKIQFETDEHDFGPILKGEKVTYTFRFKNIGKGNLIISDVTTSCGCTVPKFTTKPIASGMSGEIEVIFDSTYKQGIQHKTINVWTNCQPNKKQLLITADVIVPKEQRINN